MAACVLEFLGPTFQRPVCEFRLLDTTCCQGQALVGKEFDVFANMARAFENPDSRSKR